MVPHTLPTFPHDSLWPTIQSKLANRGGRLLILGKDTDALASLLHERGWDVSREINAGVLYDAIVAVNTDVPKSCLAPDGVYLRFSAGRLIQ